MKKLWYDNFCSWLKRIKRIGLLPVVARIYQKLVKINHIIFLPFWQPFQILETSDWLLDSDEQPIRSLQYSKSFPKKAKISFVKFFFDTDSTKKPYISNLNEISVWPTCYGRKNRLVNNETVAAEPYIFCTEKKSFSYLIKTGLPIEILKILMSFRARFYQANTYYKWRTTWNRSLFTPLLLTF